ncbi:phage tail assembly chaperone [Enterobacter sp. CPE_E423]|uniref:phage tail assembly chaperone n=1 Tax=unclassified Enterobacter TaxID=2608935 RepID=UPI0039768CDF
MEFQINGVNYRTAKLSVFEQLKVSRKLLPVLAGMVSEFRSVQEKITNKDIEGAMSSILPKIAEAVSDMSDEDVNAILFPCLSVVSRDHMKGWVPVCQQGQMSFDDIDLLTMLQLVARVVADSLGNFLQGLPTSETPTPPAE